MNFENGIYFSELMASKQKMSKRSHQAWRKSMNNVRKKRVKLIDLSVKKIVPTSKTDDKSMATKTPLGPLNSTELPTIARMEKISDDLRNMANKSKCCFGYSFR